MNYKNTSCNAHNLHYTPQRLDVFWGSTKDCFPASVFAHVASNGLAYYRKLNARGTHGRYYVIHVGSGLSVLPNDLRPRNPKQCKCLIAHLDRVTDWRQSAETVRKTARFLPLLHAWQQAGYELR